MMTGTKRTVRGNYEIEDMSDFELTDEQAADFEARIEQAERDIEKLRKDQKRRNEQKDSK